MISRLGAVGHGCINFAPGRLSDFAMSETVESDEQNPKAANSRRSQIQRRWPHGDSLFVAHLPLHQSLVLTGWCAAVGKRVLSMRLLES